MKISQCQAIMSPSFANLLASQEEARYRHPVKYQTQHPAVALLEAFRKADQAEDYIGTKILSNGALIKALNHKFQKTPSHSRNNSKSGSVASLDDIEGDTVREHGNNKPQKPLLRVKTKSHRDPIKPQPIFAQELSPLLGPDALPQILKKTPSENQGHIRESMVKSVTHYEEEVDSLEDPLKLKAKVRKLKTEAVEHSNGTIAARENAYNIQVNTAQDPPEEEHAGKRLLKARKKVAAANGVVSSRHSTTYKQVIGILDLPKDDNDEPMKYNVTRSHRDASRNNERFQEDSEDVERRKASHKKNKEKAKQRGPEEFKEELSEILPISQNQNNLNEKNYKEAQLDEMLADLDALETQRDEDKQVKRKKFKKKKKKVFEEEGEY